MSHQLCPTNYVTPNTSNKLCHTNYVTPTMSDHLCQMISIHHLTSPPPMSLPTMPLPFCLYQLICSSGINLHHAPSPPVILDHMTDHSSSTHQPVTIYSSYPIITNITEIHSLIITVSAIYTMGAINTVNIRGVYIYACTALQLIWRVPPLYLLNLI